MTPEEKARQQIDAMLTASGWIIKGTTLSAIADQSGRYASSLPDFLAAVSPAKLPFLYESTGVETFFRDERDPHPRSRPVFSFHRPETLAEWLAQPDTVRARLQYRRLFSSQNSSRVFPPCAAQR